MATARQSFNLIKNSGFGWAFEVARPMWRAFVWGAHWARVAPSTLQLIGILTPPPRTMRWWRTAHYAVRSHPPARHAGGAWRNHQVCGFEYFFPVKALVDGRAGRARASGVYKIDCMRYTGLRRKPEGRPNNGLWERGNGNRTRYLM